MKGRYFSAQTSAMLTLAGLVRSSRSLSSQTFSSLSSVLTDSSLVLPCNQDEGRQTFSVFNPAEPETIIAQVPVMDQNDAQSAIERSHGVLPSWRDHTTASSRASLLQEWSRLIKENAEDIATIMTLESGKPLRESKGEIAYGLSFLDFYAGEAIRSTGAGGGFIVPSTFATPAGGPRGQMMAVQQAVGVTALITPWNFPIAMLTRKIGPALAAGCTAVVKPSELTPLTAIALQTLADRAGIPPNVLQLVTADTASTPGVGNEFCTNPLVSKVSFTGSTPVGKLLMKESSGTMKRLSLELGGNAPFVVFEDADLDQAVVGAMASKFRNAGQTCVCADRFLVHASIFDEFVKKFQQAIEGQLTTGPGMDGATTMGPLISAAAVNNVDDKVQEAIREGATCVLGGTKLKDLGTHFYAPTILTNVSESSKIWNTETFGPVAAVMKFDTEDEALAIANNVRVGLASYFCTKDMSRTFRFANQLESGIVGINDGIFSTAVAPFGGIKESGLGREGSSMGIAEFLETKYIFLNA